MEELTVPEMELSMEPSMGTSMDFRKGAQRQGGRVALKGVKTQKVLEKAE